MKGSIEYDLITGPVGIYLAPVSAEKCQLTAAPVRLTIAWQRAGRRLAAGAA